MGGHAIATDVADLEANRAAVAFATEQAGGLDLAFLNAGVSSGCGVGDDFDLALYRRAMGANLDGVVFGTHAVLPALRARGGGAIVATASLAGLTAVPFDPLYAANKHAVVGLARSLGPALAGDGIRFNAVCPGSRSRRSSPRSARGCGGGRRRSSRPRPSPTRPAAVPGDASGECWFVQPHREPAPFAFRGVPGPGTAPARRSSGPGGASGPRRRGTSPPSPRPGCCGRRSSQRPWRPAASGSVLSACWA